MELSRVEKFKALNSKDIPNIKDCEGQILKPVAFYTHEYEDSESKSHHVLVIKDGKTGNMFRTEVKAFIDKLMAYYEAFGTLPDEEKPEIVIQIQTSKKGNRYVNFDVLDIAE